MTVARSRRAILTLGGLGLAGAAGSVLTPSTTAEAATTVTSVNGLTGAVTLTADSVGAASEARLRNHVVLATPDNFVGIDPTGKTSSSLGLKRAINAAPDGATVVVPSGTYLLDTRLDLRNKSITLDLTTAVLQLVAKPDGTPPEGAIDFRGSWGTTYPVASATTGTVTIDGRELRTVQVVLGSGTAPYQKGDVIKLIADDLIAGARPGSGGLESRVGQFLVVESVSGTTITTLCEELIDTFSKNLRVSLLNPVTCHVIGGRITVDASKLTTWVTTAVLFKDMVRPTITGLEVSLATNQHIQLMGCYGYQVDGCTLDYAPNNPDANRLGYGVLDNSCSFGFISNTIMRNVRHAYTDDTARVAVGATDVGAYGRTYKTKIHDSHGHGTSGITWDTHSASQGVEFLNCTATGSGPAGFGLRGRKHRVTSGEAVGTNDGILIYTEDSVTDSWGHVVDGLTLRNIKSTAINATMNKAETRGTTIRNVQTDGCGQLLYAKFVTLEMTAITFRAPPAVSDDGAVLIANASDVTVQGLFFDFRRNTSGARLIPITLSNGCILRAQGVSLVAGSTATANRLAYFIRAANTTALCKAVIPDLLMDYAPGPINAGPVFNPTGFDGTTTIGWHSTDESKGYSSGHYLWNTSTTTNEPNGANYVSGAFTRAPDQTIVISFAVEFQSTLFKLRNGRYLGQQLVLVNLSTIGKNLIVKNGVSGYNTITLTGADVTLTPGKVMQLIWLGAGWRQL
ncbi:hypothetical protein [Subtercola boreus]|uniref:hypothetical protein n=1 Tax=Subtercola boreus TaxID=120213 RepID=UPI0011C08249|nr:hypothetical protein [Subtercola boreus]